MSTDDPIREMPASAPQRGVWYASERRDPIHDIAASPPQGVRPGKKRAYVMTAIAGVALIGAFAISPVGPGLGHRILASVPAWLPPPHHSRADLHPVLRLTGEAVSPTARLRRSSRPAPTA